MSFVSDFLPFFDELKLIDWLSAPLSLKTYHTLPPYVIMQSLRHVIYIYYSQFYHRLSGNDKKWSIFKVCFLPVNGLKRSILAKNRLTCIFFILFFAENRKFVSLFVLQLFAFKLSKSSIIGRLDNYKISMALVLYFK